MKPLPPRITQNELARKLGLSFDRGGGPQSFLPDQAEKETRERVVRAAEKWHYRPDRYARVMRGGKSGLIGLLHFGGLLQVAAERAFYATEALRRANYEILSADFSWNPGSTRSSCLSMIDARVEGVVVASLNDPHALQPLELFRAANIPMVVLSGNSVAETPHFRGEALPGLCGPDPSPPGPGPSASGPDASHLRTAGHHPAIYSWTAGERLRGFRAALHQEKGRWFPPSKKPGREGPRA